jgi:hypothetical protein
VTIGFGCDNANIQLGTLKKKKTILIKIVGEGGIMINQNGFRYAM